MSRDPDTFANEIGHWQLGRIKDAEIECGGIMTLWLTFDFGGMVQGFGGLALDDWSKEDDRRVGHAAGTDLIIGITSALGARRWSDLSGKPAWAIRASGQWSAPIIGVARLACDVADAKSDGDGIFLVSRWRERWFPPRDIASATVREVRL